MKNLNKITLIFLLVFLCGVLPAQELSITISNSSMGLIRETRELSLTKGVQEYKFTNIPKEIIPSSVLIESEEQRFNVLEQNYEYDLINSDKTLAKSIDKDIWVLSPDDKPISGKLLSFSEYNIMLLDENNQLTILSRNDKQQILLKDFGESDEEFITKPTLIWKLNAKKKGKHKARISYLSWGLDWRADYVALLNSDTEIKLSSWVTVTNNSGRAFKNAGLKLMAGDMNIAYQNNPKYMEKSLQLNMAAPNEEQFSEKSFFEYHLYSLQRKTDIGNNQIKQIQLFPETTAKIEKKYRIKSGTNNKVNVLIALNNSKSNNLGIALPAGIVRLYKKDGDDLEFIGEDHIDHTPKGAKIEIKTGQAFDLSYKRELISTKRPSKRSMVREVKYTIKNHKNTPVDIEVLETVSPYQQVKLNRSNIILAEQNAKYLKFIVHIEADNEKTLHFDYITTW